MTLESSINAEDLRPTALAKFQRILWMPWNGGGTHGREGREIA